MRNCILSSLYFSGIFLVLGFAASVAKASPSVENILMILYLLLITSAFNGLGFFAVCIFSQRWKASPPKGMWAPILVLGLVACAIYLSGIHYYVAKPLGLFLPSRAVIFAMYAMPGLVSGVLGFIWGAIRR